MHLKSQPENQSPFRKKSKTKGGKILVNVRISHLFIFELKSISLDCDTAMNVH